MAPPRPREPRSAEVRYIRDLRHVWSVAQALVSQGLLPLLRVWPTEEGDEGDERSDSNEYNPLARRGRIPRIWNLSDADLRRRWPNIDPADIRRFTPWAVTRDEVVRIAFPGGDLPASDPDIEEFVRRSIESARAATPPPLRQTSPPSPKGPLAFIARPRTPPPPVLGPEQLPLFPPQPTQVTRKTIKRQIDWCRLVLGETITETTLDQMLSRAAGTVDNHVVSEMKRVLPIDLRREVPALAAQLDEWKKLNVGLIESGIRGPSDGVRLSSLADDVAETIGSAHSEGLRVEVLASELSERYGVSTSRAELIARDQVLKLNGQLNRSRQQAAGVRRYRWSTSGDERVRESHQALDGTIQSWDAPPLVGHPGEDVQCRCTAIPILPEEE